MSVLDEILDGVRADLAERQEQVSLDDLKAKAARQPPARDPMPMLRSPGVSVIAEVKRSSPSRGALAAIADPAALAARLRGWRALRRSACSPSGTVSAAPSTTSKAVRDAVDVPVLCKDFIVTSYQLWEARAYGADLALLHRRGARAERPRVAGRAGRVDRA